MKKLALAILFLIGAFGVSAQTKEYKSGFLLWKVSGKDLVKPSYLLGTMHFKSGTFLDSIPGAKSALNQAEQVVGEIAMSDMPDLLKKTQEAIIMGTDTTYRMLYTDEEYKLVSEELASVLGTGLDQLAMLKPAGISMMYTQISLLKKYPNFNPATAIDAFVQQLAVETQKPVLGLETVESQLQLLFSSSLKEQSDDLLCMMKNPEYGKEKQEEMLVNYDKKDLNALYLMLKDKNNPCASSNDDVDRLNKNRNEAWMLQLPSLMKEKSSFVVVGALHLAGEEGLINQLERSGYQVEAVVQ